jgi:hypothetical protein
LADECTVSELVKKINDEYAVLLASERANLPRAMSIGDKLINLRRRVSKQGKWQDWLGKNFPKMSYETAALYYRLAENKEELAKRAREKSVTVTDLTIRQARELLAKPNPNKAGSKGKKVRPGAVEEPGDAKANSPSTRPEDTIKDLDADELFILVRDNCDAEKLRKLSDLLRDHITKVAVRRPLSDAATRAASPPT